MYIKIMVMIPTKLSGREKDLLKDLAKIQGNEESPEPVPLSEL